MPTTTEWTAPELFMTHNGVNVFHVYYNDDIDQGRERSHFTLNGRHDGHDFDARYLDTPSRKLLDCHPPHMVGERRNDPGLKAAWHAWHNEAEPKIIKDTICEALDAGLIELPEDMEDNADPNAPTGYQQVLVEVRRTDGPLTADEAREMVNTMLGIAEADAQDSLKNCDFEDTETARLVAACEFSVTLP